MKVVDDVIRDVHEIRLRCRRAGRGEGRGCRWDDVIVVHVIQRDVIVEDVVRALGVALHDLAGGDDGGVDAWVARVDEVEGSVVLALSVCSSRFPGERIVKYMHSVCSFSLKLNRTELLAVHVSTGNNEHIKVRV